MLSTLILAFVVVALAVTGMAIGAIFTGRTIKGSCGGIGNIDGIEPIPCDCDNPCDKKLKRMAEEAAAEPKPLQFDLHKKTDGI